MSDWISCYFLYYCQGVYEKSLSLDIGCWHLWKGERTGPWPELGPRWKTDSIPVILERARWSTFSWFHTVAVNMLTSVRKPGKRTLQMPLSKLCCCCSVIKLCPVLCDFMDCSMPGFSVLHYLLESAQILAHWVGDAILPSHLLLPTSFALSLPLHHSLFQWVNSLHQVAEVLEHQLLASVLPMNIQGWFPLEVIGLISLQSKGLSVKLPWLLTSRMLQSAFLALVL